ncbi:MAG: rhodanese-like domain-containing protein, partial [Deinococcales bacterium]
MKRLVAALATLAFLLTLPAFAQGPAPTPGSEAFAKVIAEASQSGWLQVQPQAALQQIDAIQPFLLDVRNQSEWDQNGHIDGAVLVPVTELANNLDKLPSDMNQPILVYCAAGTRGFYGMLYLKMLGYANVKNIAGGFGAWTAAGLPVA